MHRWFGPLLVCVLLLPFVSAPALAQGGAGGGAARLGWNGWGVRVGASSDPDQFHAGVHFELGEFARDVRFRPTIEIGSGDDVTIVQAAAEAHYVFSKVQVWKPYVGGGIGLTWARFDDNLAAVVGDDNESDILLMGIGGIETKLKSATRFFLELKIGFGDEDPDLKLAVGWGWK